MTILNAAVLLATAYTLCLSAEITTPNYSQQRYHYLEAVEVSSELISLKAPEDLKLPSVKRQYIILLGAVVSLSEDVSANCSSDTYQKLYLPVMNDMILQAWQDPVNVIQEFETKIDAIEDRIEPLMQIIEKYCDKVNLRSAAEDYSCNHLIDLQVKLAPEKYEEPVKILKNFAAAAKIYLDDPHTEVAERQGVIPYLLDANNELQPLVMSLAKAIRGLDSNGVKCEEEEKI